MSDKLKAAKEAVKDAKAGLKDAKANLKEKQAEFVSNALDADATKEVKAAFNDYVKAEKAVAKSQAKVEALTSPIE